nr:VanW family protein [Cellulomonas chengniuliangii]
MGTNEQVDEHAPEAADTPVPDRQDRVDGSGIADGATGGSADADDVASAAGALAVDEEPVAHEPSVEADLDDADAAPAVDADAELAALEAEPVVAAAEPGAGLGAIEPVEPVEPVEADSAAEAAPAVAHAEPEAVVERADAEEAVPDAAPDDAADVDPAEAEAEVVGVPEAGDDDAVALDQDDAPTGAPALGDTDASDGAAEAAARTQDDELAPATPESPAAASATTASEPTPPASGAAVPAAATANVGDAPDDLPAREGGAAGQDDAAGTGQDAAGDAAPVARPADAEPSVGGASQPGEDRAAPRAVPAVPHDEQRAADGHAPDARPVDEDAAAEARQASDGLPVATPTSAAPTSAAPTSAAPTSAAPTSAAPTSAAPTSAAPTSAAPTGGGSAPVAGPVSDAPRPPAVDAPTQVTPSAPATPVVAAAAAAGATQVLPPAAPAPTGAAPVRRSVVPPRQDIEPAAPAAPAAAGGWQGWPSTQAQATQAQATEAGSSTAAGATAAGAAAVAGTAASTRAPAPSAPYSASAQPALAAPEAAPGPSRPQAAGSAAAATSASEEPPAAASPLDQFDSPERPRRWPRVLLVSSLVAVVLGGAYVAAAYALGGRVPRGATVAGVEIGGMDAGAAEDALRTGLADLSTSAVPVAAGEKSATLDPVSAGLTLDIAATVDSLTGVDLSPARMWQHLVGVDDKQPVTAVDESAFDTAVEGLDDALALAPVDGAIVFVDGDAHATDAVDGLSLDVDAAAEVLRAGWLTADRPLQLPTTVVAPDITQEETDTALQTVARRVVAAPVSLQVADQVVNFSPDTLAAVSTMAPDGSSLTLQMDGAALVAEVLEQTTDLLTESADAHFEFVNGAPQVIPGEPGTTLDPQAVADAVAAAAVADVRSATVELVPSDPEQSTAKLEALGVKEVVAQFRTPLNSEPKRTKNITLGASRVNGTVVLPGEVFSLAETVGPVTAASGYIAAGVINNGEHVDGMGGGLSQLATTTFNVGHEAGFEDVEHKPHSEWISRYPEGREATLYTPSVDMKWKNNTPYGVVLQAWIADGHVNVAAWSTKYWTVESTTSARSNVKPAGVSYSSSPTCQPQSAGSGGFSVTVTRKVSLNGEVKSTESKTTTYKAANKIVCGPPPTE